MPRSTNLRYTWIVPCESFPQLPSTGFATEGQCDSRRACGYFLFPAYPFLACGDSTPLFRLGRKHNARASNFGFYLKELMLERVKEWFSAEGRQASVQEGLDKLREKTPVPVLWLFGKTQTGKSSLVRFLTGAADAEIGEGFRPCTRHSRQYDFPTPEVPLLRFLDTRGLDEPGYDPAEDLQSFDASAQVVVVTAKLLDHAQENSVRHLRALRKAQPSRPILLLATCLHEAYPLTQHPKTYPFVGDWKKTWLNEGKPFADAADHPCLAVDGPVRRSLLAQEDQFAGLIDVIVPVDLTKPEEGFEEPNFGGR